ncbi:unnamed protein product [Clonostachys chloroleuca]|uniref:Uncharacterized protein n=1 Tax=Clonostachys chloroleuca TaxID=1926264 RepID=A0AA35PZ95_9HYPO|nr:unnamed protein product [Clonostachys chloroleuca]
MAGIITFVGFLIFTFGLVVPVAFFIFYTAYSVFPILAAVEDLDASIYESISIVVPRVVDEAEGPTRLGKDGGAKPLPVSTSLRSMTRLLYSSRRCFSFCRGYSWFFLFGIVKSLALGVCLKSPLLGFLAQILLPLAATHFHALWVHSVLSTSSRMTHAFQGHAVEARRLFRTAGPPMALYLTSEAVVQRIMLQYYKGVGMKWEDFMPIAGMHFHKSFMFWMLLAVLTFFLVVPAYVVLVRAEASLLPSGEQTLVPLDPALETISEDGVMALVGAWRSLKRPRVVNLVFLYIRMFMITVPVTFVLGFIDFAWYIVMAMQSWRF